MSDNDRQLSLLIKALGARLSPERTEQTFQSLESIAQELEKLRSLDLHDVHPAVVYQPLDMQTGDKHEF